MMKEHGNIPKTNPFKVPEGYFEEVNLKIIAAAGAQKQERSTRRPVVRLRPYLLAAASVAVLCIISYTAIRIFNPDTQKNLRSEMTGEEYLSPYMNEIDTWYLEENAAKVINSDQTTGISKNEIIDYLIFDNIEIDDIYEQL